MRGIYALSVLMIVGCSAESPSSPSSSEANAGGGGAGTGGYGSGEGGTGGGEATGGAGGANSGAGGEGGGQSVDPITVVLSGLRLPMFLKCDGTHISWVSGEDGGVSRAKLDGSDLVTVVSPIGRHVADFEFGGDDAYVGAEWPRLGVYRVSFPGMTMIAIDSDVQARDVSVCGGVAYWTAGGDIASSAGAVIDSPTALVGINVDDSGIYFSEFASNGVWAMGSSGGPPRMLASADTPSRPMVTTATHVIWTTLTKILSVPKSGGNAEVVSDSRANTISVNNGVVAWTTDSDVHAFVDGVDRKVADAGRPGGVAVCDGSVYWASMYDGTIMKERIEDMVRP